VNTTSGPLRVLYLCHADNYHIQTWSAALRRKGAQITHLTLRPKANNDFHQIILSKTGSQIRYWDFLTIAQQIRRVFDKGDYDILFASFANTYGLSAILSQSKPVVVQTWSRDVGADRSVSPREQLMNQTIGKFVMDKADAITTDGAHFKEHLLGIYPEFAPKTLSTGWGIDLNHFQKVLNPERETSARSRWNIPAKAPVLTSIRGIFWYYQPEIIFPALLRLLDVQTDLHILLPTLGHPLQNSLQSQFETLNKHPRVIVFDQLLDSEEMTDLWSATDIFLSLPSFDGVAESVQEGLFSGAVAVLNKLESNQLICGELDDVIWTDAVSPSPESLVKTLLTALEKHKNFDPENQRKHIEQNWSVDVTAERLLNLFRSVSEK